MTHELNMIDYLDEIEKLSIDKKVSLYRIFKHKRFLKSPPKLGDFVPCTKDGEVMEKSKLIGGMREGIDDVYQKDYQSALDRVLWKGWEWIKYSDTASMYDLKHKDCSKVIANKNRGVTMFHYTDTTYEQLITSGVKLERIQKK